MKLFCKKMKKSVDKSEKLVYNGCMDIKMELINMPIIEVTALEDILRQHLFNWSEIVDMKEWRKELEIEN